MTGTLIAFGGLPGTGKTTLARALAAARAATYLRIDTMEQTLRSAAVLSGAVGPAGYLLGYALARDNLRLGLTVIADSVNPLEITRDAWRDVAAETGASIIEIEVVCSDQAEHRRRVEARSADIAGLVLPTWQGVLEREYDDWHRPRIMIDTSGLTLPEALETIQSLTEAGGIGVTFRSIRDTDYDELGQLWWRSWRSTGLSIAQNTQEQLLRERIDIEMADGWQVTVAVHDERLIGFLALKPGLRVLDQLFVDPAFKRRGIGRHLLAIAKATMPDGFSLDTAVDNKAACAFYDRAGLTRTGTEQHKRFDHMLALYRWN